MGVCPRGIGGRRESGDSGLTDHNDNSGWLEMITSGALLGTIYNSFLKKEGSVVLEE